MANVPTTLYSWSQTEGSNQPDSADSATVQADLQAVQAGVRGWLAHKGADIASATTTDIGAVAGSHHDITGTTTITGLGTVSAGIWKVLQFDGALTLTHNATSLILPGGANITTAAGDVAVFVSEGSGNWRCTQFQPALGGSVPFTDTQAVVMGSADKTKKIRFEVDGLTTATTRVITVPDKDGTMAMTSDLLTGGVTEIVASTSLPAAQSVDITNIATDQFAYLLLIIDGASFAGNNASNRLDILADSDNGASFDSTAGNYIGIGGSGGAKAIASLHEDDAVELQTGTNSVILMARIYGHRSGPWTMVESVAVYSSGTVKRCSCIWKNNSALNALQIRNNTAVNFDAGTYRLYGIA